VSGSTTDCRCVKAQLELLIPRHTPSATVLTIGDDNDRSETVPYRLDRRYVLRRRKYKETRERRRRKYSTNFSINLTSNTFPAHIYREHLLKMRFSAVIISALAALASAAPNELIARNNDQVADAIRYAALADGCSLIKCAEVVANVACIAAALIAVPESGGTTTAAVVACVKEGLGEVCFPH
jgi:hypothetical protein